MTPADRLIQAASPLCDLDVAATCAALCPTGIRGATGVLTGAEAVASFERLSTCEMAAATVIRQAFGLPDPVPYVEGTAARMLEQLVNAWPDLSPRDPSRPSALYRPTLARPPVVGGLVWYGAANGHSEHVDACVVDLAPAALTDGLASTIVYSAYAGGQPPAEGMPGSWAVRIVARTLTWTGEAWRDDATGRIAMACSDPEALAQMYGGGA